MAKVKKEAEGKYEATHPADLLMLVAECNCTTKQSGIAWAKIGAILKVSCETMRRWRDPQSEYYHEEFLKASKIAKEAIDAHEIKLGVIALAKPHKTFDITRELKTVGPKPPPASSLKAYLIEWADKVLDYEIDPAYTKTEVYKLIERECFEQTEAKMVTVKEREREEVDMNAVKLVLANVGPEDERWLDKKEVKTPEDQLSDEDCANLRAILAENQK